MIGRCTLAEDHERPLRVPARAGCRDDEGPNEPADAIGVGRVRLKACGVRDEHELVVHGPPSGVAAIRDLDACARLVEEAGRCLHRPDHAVPPGALLIAGANREDDAIAHPDRRPRRHELVRDTAARSREEGRAAKRVEEPSVTTSTAAPFSAKSEMTSPRVPASTRSPRTTCASAGPRWASTSTPP